MPGGPLSRGLNCGSHVHESRIYAEKGSATPHERAGALQDTRLFFRALIEIGILALFLFPDGTIAGTAGFFTSLADFGDYMKKSASVFLVWSIIGAILALTELYALGRRSTRSSNAPVRRVQPAPPAPRPDGQ